MRPEQISHNNYSDNNKTTTSIEILILFGILVVGTIPLAMKVGQEDATRHMEVMSLVSSQETWLRQHAGESQAWLIPSWNGRDRLNKPPLLVWLNFLAWQGLDPEKNLVPEFVFRARIMGIFLVLLSLTATYWMGRMIGGPALAWKAALAAGSMIFLIRQGRLASYDTHLLGWVSLTICTGWAAMRPGYESAGGFISRALAIISGFALAAAYLTKGPISLIFTITPLVIAGILFDRRVSNFLTCLIIILTGVIATLPWYMIIFKLFPEAGKIMGNEYQASGLGKQPFYYYLALLGLVFPWTFSFFGALGLPFQKNKSPCPRPWWIPLSWLVFIILVMSIPHVKRERYIFPVLPAAGLLIAQWWQSIANSEKAGRSLLPWDRFIKKSHVIMLIVGSVGIGLFAFLQPLLLKLELLKAPELPGFEWEGGIILGTILTTIAYSCLRFLSHHRGANIIFALTGIWFSLTASCLFYFYVDSYHSDYPGRKDAEKIAAMAEDTELVYLSLDRFVDQEPDQKFLFYSRRVIKGVSADRLQARLNENCPLGVIARAKPDHDLFMAPLGLKPSLSFNDGRCPRRLYLWKKE